MSWSCTSAPGQTTSAQELSYDELAHVQRNAGAVDQVSVELGREVASLSRQVTERVERPCSNPLGVAVEQATRRLGVGRSSMLTLVGSGRARSVRVGGLAAGADKGAGRVPGTSTVTERSAKNAGVGKRVA